MHSRVTLANHPSSSSPKKTHFPNWTSFFFRPVEKVCFLCASILQTFRNSKQTNDIDRGGGRKGKPWLLLSCDDTSVLLLCGFLEAKNTSARDPSVIPKRSMLWRFGKALLYHCIGMYVVHVTHIVCSQFAPSHSYPTLPAFEDHIPSLYPPSRGDPGGSRRGGVLCQASGQFTDTDRAHDSRIVLGTIFQEAPPGSSSSSSNDEKAPKNGKCRPRAPDKLFRHVVQALVTSTS